MGSGLRRDDNSVIAGLDVQPGDMADTCSDTSPALFGLVKSIVATWWAAKNTILTIAGERPEGHALATEGLRHLP